MSTFDRSSIIALILELSPVPGLGAEEVEGCAELLTGGMLDSLGLLQVVEALEKATGQAIPPADITIDNFNSLDAMERLQAKLARASAA
jgi:acyl carrier protein